MSDINHEPKSLVLFDNECPLCRSLASFMKKSTSQNMDFIPWQDFLKNQQAQVHKAGIDPKIDVLRVQLADQYLQGEKAWEYLITHHPRLKSLNWLAQKLKLTKEISRSFQYAGHTIKKICFKCR